MATCAPRNSLWRGVCAGYRPAPPASTHGEVVLESPVPLTNYAGTFAPAIAETAMGMLLSLTRGIAKYYIPQFLKRTMDPVGTMKSAHHTELAGRTMGIVGMGGIGRALARKAHLGFEMRVVGTDAGSAPKPDYVAELHDPSWFLEMVSHSDVVVAAVPLTPLTERMFTEEVFRRMKKTAIFLALSRGGVFDDLALVRALKEGGSQARAWTCSRRNRHLRTIRSSIVPTW